MSVRSKFVVISFFVTYLILGLNIYNDYGISWDEPIQYEYGQKVFKYVVHKDQKLVKDSERFYGPVVEFSFVTIEKLTKLEDLKDVYLQRHLLTFLIFYTGVIFFFFLNLKILKTWKLALLGSLMLIVSPRIFADSFYNSKDIPLLALTIVSAFTALRLLEKPSFNRVLIHAIATALVVDIRIVGIYIIPVTLVLLVMKREQGFKKHLIAYLIATCFFIVAFWPTLWNQPVKNFYSAFVEMSRYDQSTGGLFFGEQVRSKKVPWFYIPGWILVTTPITYLIGFVVGLIVTLNTLRKRFDKPQIFVLAWLFIPLASVITLQSVLYNAWRQMFFIYPAMIIICLIGLSTLKRHRGMFALALILILMDIFGTTLNMYKNHPFQNVYFNHKTNAFDLDYWGLSYRKALEHIVSYDNRDQITISTLNLPGVTNAALLEPNDRSRITVTKKASSYDYFITNYPEKVREKPWYCVNVENHRLSCIYKKIN